MARKDLVLDGIDKQILNALMKDARMSLTAIGREIGISSVAVNQRIKKLEQSGLRWN